MRKRFFIGIAIFTLATAVALGIGTMSNILSFSKSFSVMVDNQSDFDIVSIETGILQMKFDTKDSYSNTIKSGQKVKIKPELSLRGEGSIYMIFIDSRGTSIQETVCGYTEYLSGYSEVTITNERIKVVEKCN